MGLLETVYAQLPFGVWVTLAAFVLDVLLGDPRLLPHPVIFVGRLVRRLELALAGILGYVREAGVLLLLATLFFTALVAVGTLLLAGLIHPLLGSLATLWLAWSTLALRSLHRETSNVVRLVEKGKIIEARRALSMVVGRQTSQLDEQGVLRACIETVAENTSTGVVAPLVYLFVGGPVLGVLFKAVQTLDSMVAYRDEKYRELGWASARMDDLVNWIPARLTALSMVLVAPLVGLAPLRAWSTVWRDARKHSSPNAGFPEAAAAGAIGIQLGGPATYLGETIDKATLGADLRPVVPGDYRRMVRLMYASSILTLFLGTWLRMSFESLFTGGS